MQESNKNYSFYKIPLKTVLDAYKDGLFPMAETANSKEIYWVEPKKRGVFFFDRIRVPKKLKRIAKTSPFEISVDLQFEKVIENCSKLTSTRKDTWINQTIKLIYLELFHKGYAHSIECYLNKKLVGGLYGVSIGGVFFGESMFSFVNNSSKFALFHLIERLKFANFDFIDTQFINRHLEQFGAIEISNSKFKRILKEGINKKRNFYQYHTKGFLPKNLFPLNSGII